ncbi:hypothetical protein Scep_009258 [Stephania cephalantha]|uniref:Uncharacterized protein n=1 Tax=Stephania cephalantha TaxID=152367 RepID=A0AAP0JV84_9MAGN
MESSKELKVKVLEETQVAPPPLALTKATLPLTYFDLPLLLVAPPEMLFFYKLPNIDITQFMCSILPQIKHSLSLTLQHFYPLAGNLIWSPQLNQLVVRFIEGDSIPLTAVESHADFNHLSGYHTRDAKDFQHLIPQLVTLEDSSSRKKQSIPACAMQITLFPSWGICLGITLLHLVIDGRAFTMFLKSWASVSRLGNASLLSHDQSIAPLLDRSIINDVDNVLRERYWWRLVEFIRSKSMSEENCSNWLALSMDPNIPPNQVVATFVLGRSDIERLRKLWASMAHESTNSTTSGLLQYPSRFELACAYVLVCLAKIPSKTSHCDKEEMTSIVFPIDCRARLDPPIPATYFGNCFLGIKVSAKRRDIVGEDGIAAAVDTVMKAVRGLGGGEVVMKYNKEALDILIAHANGLHGFDAISGSTQFMYYEALDFGWGRPEKVEFMTKTKVSVYFADCRNGDDGGLEISLLRGKDEVDAFAVSFVEGLKLSRI